MTLAMTKMVILSITPIVLADEFVSISTGSLFRADTHEAIIVITILIIVTTFSLSLSRGITVAHHQQQLVLSVTSNSLLVQPSLLLRFLILPRHTPSFSGREHRHNKVLTSIMSMINTTINIMALLSMIVAMVVTIAWDTN